MYIKTNDGKLWNVSDNTDLVHKLKNESRTRTKTVEEYMKLCSRWSFIYNKAIIRHDSIDNFVNDLLKYDILQKWSVV
tara:strand:+ start:337 stop:570 length:234 start_codon:yes stop_codon:yes gene_type:complete